MDSGLGPGRPGMTRSWLAACFGPSPQPDLGDAQRHLRFEEARLGELAGGERVAHRELDLALRSDADDLEEFADIHVETVFVHGFPPWVHRQTPPAANQPGLRSREAGQYDRFRAENLSGAAAPRLPIRAGERDTIEPGP